MITLMLSPLTKNAIEKIKEHFDDTSIKDKIIMRSIGVKQELKGGTLIITIDNKAINMLPDELSKRNIIQKNIYELESAIQKHGISKDEYLLEVDYGGR